MSGTFPWILSKLFLSCRFPPADEGQTEQAQSNPDQFAEPPEQREGDAGHVAVAEGLEEEQIASVLGPEAAGDEEGAAFDKDGEGADGDGGEGQGGTAEIVDDDVDFQRFRHPTEKEEPGGSIEGRTFLAVEVQDRAIQ